MLFTFPQLQNKFIWNRCRRRSGRQKYVLFPLEIDQTVIAKNSFCIFSESKATTQPIIGTDVVKKVIKNQSPCIENTNDRIQQTSGILLQTAFECIVYFRV